ncbi:cytochrome P450 6A1 [Biscogniauxia sp. FL1348]|nr:cytochrome P450 6A1 [Biscogniauxia sp. FL1348]
MSSVTMAATTLLRPQNWPTSVWVLLLATLFTGFFQVFWRPSLPKNAPNWFKTGDWPILGALCFYKTRGDWFKEGLKHSPTGNFSFYIGKKQIIGMSGPEGRKTFYENRELNFTEGFAELLTGQPAATAEAENFAQIFSKALVPMMRKENLSRNLVTLCSDARRACEGLAGASSAAWAVTNPFDSLYGIVYQLTMRTVGAEEIANDPALLRSTLAIFEGFEGSESIAHVVFPWLPTPKHLIRIYNGARLAMVFQRIVEKRRTTGKRREDSLQNLIDQGLGIKDIVAFVIGALYAGQLNSGINAAWLHLYLAQSPEWLARVRGEIDGVVARHRRSAAQSAADVLDTLPIDAWETEFPLIDLCLRESIRLSMPGAAFRKNISGHDIPIGSTGEVIPNGAFAAFLVDDVMLNSEWYTDPTRFDPGRYLEDRAEDKKVPHAYVGWGSGRHPCLGMRFARLEMALIAAYFMAMFDFELSDRDGNPPTEAPEPVSRNFHSAKKPPHPIYLRYRPRTQG